MLFSPLFGEDSHFDEHIFSDGWFNHQPDVYRLRPEIFEGDCQEQLSWGVIFFLTFLLTHRACVFLIDTPYTKKNSDTVDG